MQRNSDIYKVKTINIIRELEVVLKMKMRTLNHLLMRIFTHMRMYIIRNSFTFYLLFMMILIINNSMIFMIKEA